MAREIWQDPRTIKWVEGEPFLLNQQSGVCFVDGKFALSPTPRISVFDLTIPRRYPIIREGKLQDEEAVREYMEYTPDDPDSFVTKNFRLSIGVSLIVAGYQIKRLAPADGGLYLGIAAARKANILAIKGDFDTETFLRRSRKFRR